MKKNTLFLLIFLFVLTGMTASYAVDYLSSTRLVLNDDAFYYTNGNIGMGTTSPLGALDIAKNNSSDYLLNFITTHTSSSATGFGFYSNAMTTLTDGAMALRRIELRLNTDPITDLGRNILVVGSKNIGIGSFAEPGDSDSLPTEAKLQVNGNVYIGTTINDTTHKLNGIIQKPDGTGAAFLTPTGEEISFGYDTDDKQFKLLIDGQAIFFATSNSEKTFVTAHPNNPNLHLVHAMQELPESTVQYVGSTQLKNGQATVTLPGYFEALTRQEGRYIRLSNIDGFDTIKIKKNLGQDIHQGTFTIISNNPKSSQIIDWEVTAVRQDVPQLNPTPLKKDITIKGRPPYTYLEESL
jgi:hypothetical protein